MAVAQEVPSLMEDLVEEILLRFPPDDPGSLVSAALVCKAWCRFREFHHRRSSPPPVLGFFCGIYTPSDAYISPGEPRFMPLLPSSFRRLPHASLPNWRAVDARHGRVLFYDKDTVVDLDSVRLRLIVWNPVTGKASTLPVAPVYTPMDRWNAALLCDDDVDSPFRVVLVTTTAKGLTSARVYYSTEQQAWSTPVSSVQHQYSFRLLRGRNALIGNNALYFKCDQGRV
ncbi:hypothetical protein PR202_gb14076 [Eleusine coracana subsp. coracana]|uniref:F-box domain-containing protein n=1 Tax=Eleusine coracana subsp. coracana TaxID=191504 RepID=A0AAV5EU90_ELECO|nr:hypothetical protein PR202_gb14076 [Eleusine coracana subsp. coracana]